MLISDILEETSLPKFSLSSDIFIHFTTMDRAKEILKSGRLLANPPYKKFGIAGVQAISVNNGVYLPGVQTKHIRSEGNPLVAVLFKTDTLPKVGHPEEVIWSHDVKLLDAKIISKPEAIAMLKGSDFSEEGLVDTFLYE